MCIIYYNQWQGDNVCIIIELNVLVLSCIKNGNTLAIHLIHIHTGKLHVGFASTTMT